MAKITKKFNFTKGSLSKTNDGKYILTEILKDDLKNYDLTSVLDSFVGNEGITLSIGVDDEIPNID